MQSSPSIVATLPAAIVYVTQTRGARTAVFGSLLAGDDLRAIPNGVIVIEDGTIAACGTTAEIDVPDDAESVDATGCTVVPGFIDAHVHIGFYPPEEVMRGGVTTARDLGWPPDVIHPLADASRRADFEGPTLLAAGPMLTAPGGYPTRASWAPAGTGIEVTSPAHASEVVARVVAQGAHVVKVALNPPVGPTLSLETLTVIVDSAHTHGRAATGHIHGLEELDKALDAGIDELAHMLMSSDALPDRVISRMVDNGVAVVPTLAIRRGRDRRVAIDNTRRFLDAGGTVVYGTDLGNEGPRPGIDRTEIRSMTKAGMSTRAVIASATVVAAQHLGLPTKGVLAPGMDADLVALAGDPLADERVLTRVAMVWRAGHRVR